jgi:hypothetical protein
MNGDKKIVEWLAEDDNPAVAYRTRTELLGERAGASGAIDWIKGVLPPDWKDTKGLWLTYHYNAAAECGIDGLELGIKKSDVTNYFKKNTFEYNCQNFMQIRAFVMLGFEKELESIGIMEKLSDGQLLDGGFLCLHRLEKYKSMPKSCVKCNNFALLFLSECKKRNIDSGIEDKLLGYYWQHHLFYRSADVSSLILQAREGWRTIDTFYPFEVMRVGLQNIVEAFCALGYGTDKRLGEAWKMLEGKKDGEGKYKLEGTLSKSYLPKERVGRASKWVTFYALLAKKQRTSRSVNA